MVHWPFENCFMQTRKWFLLLSALSLFCAVARAGSLESGFANPPREARLRAYWWWINGNVTKAAITRDLEQMKQQGFGGALICDAGGAEQDGNAPVPHGPTFFSPQWRELYKHTLREADRLGLEMSLNIQSGWNLGGPMIKAEDAPKKLVWSKTQVEGPAVFERQLSEPSHAPELYRDLFVLAYPLNTTTGAPQQIQALEQKALIQGLGWSAPDCSSLLRDSADKPGEEEVESAQVQELTTNVDHSSVLHWKVPPGRWEILRLGYTLNDHAHISTSSEGWRGYALDPIDGRVFQSYWDQVVEPLLQDAGPLAGRTLKYLHTDSWEVEVLNWTPTLREEFRRRRGYDLAPFLPVIMGRIVDSRSVSDRFLNDFRRTIGDLAIDNHFRPFSDGAHRHGMQIHPESGGPHSVPVDSLQCLGMDDAPMSEFWAQSGRHRVADGDRFFIKQPASAAHTYGRRLVLGEGFTNIGMHWQETLWDNLKPAFDRASCEGLNLLVWHAFVCSPSEMGLPGQQYFAGTHLNPNSTWWSESGPFLAYINRTQFLLQQGLFVADACYYYGDHVPNFAQLKRSDPAKVQPGYDYDVATEEIVLNRMSVKDGRIVLPDGMSYRVLVLPNFNRISLPVLNKVKELVKAGATVIGPRPREATSLENYPQCDQTVTQCANELWADCDGLTKKEHSFGKGRVIWGKTAREVLRAENVAPDFEVNGGSPSGFDYIHRRDGDTDIYFVVNSLNSGANVSCVFRIAGKAPEVWLPDTGEIVRSPIYEEKRGRVEVPLRLEPYGSAFVVFRASGRAQIADVSRNGEAVFATSSAGSFTDAVQVREQPGKLLVLEAGEPGEYFLRSTQKRVGKVTIPPLPPPCLLTNAWTLHAPLQELAGLAVKPIQLNSLKSWTEFPDAKLKYFSGTLKYTREIDLGDERFGDGKRLWLDLGEVHELVEIELNGQNLGILWKPPVRVDISDVAKPGSNQLIVRVTNFWPNRIIGDLYLPEAERVTRTNIRQLSRGTPLMVSGLLGPVRLVTTMEQTVQF